MQILCQGVGELVLLASAIDSQLTKAVIMACLITVTPLLEPIVAELDARTKIEILRAISKHIRQTDWSKGITKWAEKVEKVNSYRNIVAHHTVAMSDGGLILYSAQARKLLRSIKDSKLAPPKNINEINKWVAAARETAGQGQTVLANLHKFTEKQANAKQKKRGLRHSSLFS